MSCDGGWFIGAMFAIDDRRKWMETVDYLRGNRDEEICRHKTTIRPLACIACMRACAHVCVCVCVCVSVSVRKRERGRMNERR